MSERAFQEIPSMTNHIAAIPDPQAEIRWREWQARGAAGDRRTAVRMRGLMLVLVALLVAWLFVVLV
jgi:hypothetical protein